MSWQEEVLEEVCYKDAAVSFRPLMRLDLMALGSEVAVGNVSQTISNQFVLVGNKRVYTRQITGIALLGKEDRMVISPCVSKFKKRRAALKFGQSLKSFIGDTVQVTMYVIRKDPTESFRLKKEVVTGPLVRVKPFEFIKLAGYTPIPFVSDRLVIIEIVREDRCVLSPGERWRSTPFSIKYRLHFSHPPTVLSNAAVRLIRDVLLVENVSLLNKGGCNPDVFKHLIQQPTE